MRALRRKQNRRPIRLSLILSLFFAVAAVAVCSDDGSEPRSALQPVFTATTLEHATAALGKIEQGLTESEAVEAYRYLGTVAELHGELEVALDFYSRAGDLGSEAGKLSVAGVLYEVGRIEEAETQARRLVFGALDYAIRRRATGIVARCMAGTGRIEEAVSLLSTVAAIDEAEHLEPELLFLLVRLAERSDRMDVAAAAREKLSKHFPNSLEWSLIKGSSAVVPHPSLPFLLNTPAPEVEVSASLDEPETGSTASTVAEEKPIGVQTGSFRDRENADYMARDLRDLGFTVQVLSSDAGETRRHRVVVVTDTDQSAQNLLMELKTRGVEGFLLF